MKEFLNSVYVRLTIMAIVVVIPGLLKSNDVLREVRGLREDVAHYNAGIDLLLGLDTLSGGELEATPTATPILKKGIIGPTGQ